MTTPGSELLSPKFSLAARPLAAVECQATIPTSKIPVPSLLTGNCLPKTLKEISVEAWYDSKFHI
jgi:hypothetical protein